MRKGKLNYEGFYKIYKLLPFLCAGLNLLCFLVWGIVDAATGILLGHYLSVAAVLVWLIAGSVAAVCVAVVVSVIMSPVITRTDAILDIKRAYVNGSGKNDDVISTQKIEKIIKLPEL